MKSRISKFAAVTAIAALAVAPAAVGKHGESHGKSGESHGKGKAHGKGKGKGNPTVTYVMKGTFNEDDTVAVDKGNKHTRNAGLVDTTVAFDYTDTKIKVADTSGDGTTTIDDVVTGDRVIVKSRLPKSDPGTQPLPAKMLVDQTNPPVEEEEEAETEE